MKMHSSEFSVELMAKVLKVSRSGYYAFCSGKRQCARTERHRHLDQRIKKLFEEHQQRAGSHKITIDLHESGVSVNRKTVARRMQIHGLKALVSRKYKVVTTDSHHALPVAENLLNRNFTVPSPNEVWVTDITYIKTASGWRYLAVFIDLFSRSVVGWSLGKSLSAKLVCEAFIRAVWHRKPPRGLMVHSDRGVQYASYEFRRLLVQYGCIQSMSRKGNCWDNAVAESFFHVLKLECTNRYLFRDIFDVNKVVFEYIELYYNRKRRHSALKYRTPAEWERNYKIA
jgi:putative transposase